MAQIAVEVETHRPDPAQQHVGSSYVDALTEVRPAYENTSLSDLLLSHLSARVQVRLAEIFLEIAHSLKKPRGSLLHG